MTCRDLYAEGSAMDHFEKIKSLLKSLDPIDINLYIREQEISGDEIPNIQNIIISEGGINWSKLGCPPIDLSNSDLDSEIETKRLQISLVQQINQRAFFQEECRKLQHKIALLQEQLDNVYISGKQLALENDQLRRSIQAHEVTNLSLQKQLAESLLSSDSPEGKRLRKKAIKTAFEVEKRQKEILVSELQLEKDRVAILEEEVTLLQQAKIWEELKNKELEDKLKLANKLKDELSKQIEN
jgi:hypothetical protein